MASRPDQLSAVSRAFGRIVSDPVTWAPYLPVGAAYGFLGTPWWGAVGLALGVTAGVAAWWRRQWPLVRDKARFDNMEEWLKEENAKLETSVAEAAKRLDPRLLGAIAGVQSGAVGIKYLQSTLAWKRTIETRFLSDGTLTSDEEEVIETVAGLATAVRDELLHLSDPARPLSGDPASVATIRRAAEAIRQTAEAMDSLAQAVTPAAETANRSRMRQYIERLDERVEQANAIKKRLAEAGALVADERTAASPGASNPPPIRQAQ